MLGLASIGALPVAGFPVTAGNAYSLTADPATYTATGAAAAVKAGRVARAWQDLVGSASGFWNLGLWSVGGADVTASATNGRATLTLGPAARGGYLYQAVPVVPGRRYRFRAYLRSNSTSNAQLLLGTTLGGAQLGGGSIAYTGPTTSDAAVTFLADGPPSGIIYMHLTSTTDRSCHVDFDWASVEDVGRYTISGSPVALTKTGRIMSATGGSYALSGTAATLTVGRKMAADPGFYGTLGAVTRLLFGRRASAGAGSYLLDGSTASLTEIVGRYVHAERGTYAAAGTSVRLIYGRKMPLGGGAYTATGAPASIHRSWALIASPGAYATSGSPAALKVGYRLAPAVGAYAIVGADLNLVNYRLSTAVGSYTSAGLPAGLLAGRRLPAIAGAYVLSGINAGLLYGRKLATAAGVYTMSGTPAAALAGRKLTAGAGGYNLTGTAAALRRGYAVHATPGAYVLTGKATGIVTTRVMTLTPGSYLTTWQDMGLQPTWRPRGPRAIAVGIAASRYLAVPPQNRRVAVEPQDRRLAVEPAARRYAAVEPRDKELEGGSMLQWPEKDPNEVLDYELDWAEVDRPRLETGETLLTSVWTVVEGDVVIDELKTDFTPQGLSTVWLTGGTPATKCILLNRVTTSKGRTYDKSVVLRVRDH